MVSSVYTMQRCLPPSRFLARIKDGAVFVETLPKDFDGAIRASGVINKLWQVSGEIHLVFPLAVDEVVQNGRFALCKGPRVLTQSLFNCSSLYSE
jgi:hypothetical protein